MFGTVCKESAFFLTSRWFSVILKNNFPRYIVLEFSEVEKVQMASDEDIADISQRLIAKNLEAYKELAK